MFLLPAEAMGDAGKSRSGVKRVGCLFFGPSSGVPTGRARVTRALAKFGFMEGRNVIVDIRAADRDRSRAATLAAELVRTGPDVILTTGIDTTRALLAATRNTPIVTMTSLDPVAEGLAESLARPGGMVTGLTYAEPELPAKQVQWFRRMLPRLERIVVIVTDNQEFQYSARAFAEAAASAGLTVLWREVSDLASLEAAFQLVAGKNGGAFFSGWHEVMKKEIGPLALRLRVPLMTAISFLVSEGALMSYGMYYGNDDAMWDQLAEIVARILRGTRAGDIPFTLPHITGFAVNARTARELGIAIPPDIHSLADIID